MRKLVDLALLMLVAVLLAGCQVPTRPETVTTSPVNGATDVNPTSSVTVDHGKLTQVALTNPEGKRVVGALSADGRNWKATESLGYGKRYTYSGTATSADGTPLPVTGSFTTVKPETLVSGTLNIHDGDTVGVAAPIILQFDHHVADQAAVQRALQVLPRCRLRGRGRGCLMTTAAPGCTGGPRTTCSPARRSPSPRSCTG